MPPASNLSINLLDQDAFSSSALGKVLIWALSIGRYIVVFTELIVIFSFLSRFKLDRDLTDFNQEIVKQKAIILSYGDLEVNMRRAQTQLEYIRENTPPATPKQILDMLSQVTPPDVRIENLSLQDNGVRFTAKALSTQGFSYFVNSIAQHELVKSVSLGAVSSQDEGFTIDFELAANINKKSP